MLIIGGSGMFFIVGGGDWINLPPCDPTPGALAEAAPGAKCSHQLRFLVLDVYCHAPEVQISHSMGVLSRFRGVSGPLV